MSIRDELADLLARQNGYTSLMAVPSAARDKWRERADAIFDALMEPTEGMADSAARKFDDSIYDPPSESDCVLIFRTMIRAAKDGQ